MMAGQHNQAADGVATHRVRHEQCSSLTMRLPPGSPKKLATPVPSVHRVFCLGSTPRDPTNKKHNQQYFLRPVPTTDTVNVASCTIRR